MSATLPEHWVTCAVCRRASAPSVYADGTVLSWRTLLTGERICDRCDREEQRREDTFFYPEVQA